jgi:hypothetical protein
VPRKERLEARSGAGSQQRAGKSPHRVLGKWGILPQHRSDRISRQHWNDFGHQNTSDAESLGLSLPCPLLIRGKTNGDWLLPRQEGEHNQENNGEEDLKNHGVVATVNS